MTALERRALDALAAHFALCDLPEPDPYVTGHRDPDGTTAWEAHRQAISASWMRLAALGRELVAERTAPAQIIPAD